VRIFLVAVTLVFAAFTGWVVLHTGYVGFLEQLLATRPGWQILVDISIALALVLSWIRRDARATGRRFWPYVALTVALGSLGPLLYLVLRPAAAGSPRAAPLVPAAGDRA
jgi:hypothetical protein